MKPRVVLSRCLELEACRYNGAGIRSAVVRVLGDWVEWVPVCPEVRIGLGVPRDPIRVERSTGSESSSGAPAGALRLVQPSTGRDLTERMVGFGHAFADAAESVDGVLLKSRSPSCGMGDVKIYEGETAVTGKGWGVFAAVLRQRYPDVAMADEARLTEAAVRHEWLARVFASARHRESAGGGRAAGVGDAGDAGGVGGVGAPGASYPAELAAALDAELGGAA